MDSKQYGRRKEISPEHKEILEKIGERMKDIRKKKGYNNYEIFAYEKGLPRAQYSKYERGEGNMTIVNLLKILDAYEMTLEEFFKGI